MSERVIDWDALREKYADLDGETGDWILDAGGTGGDLSSAWFVGDHARMHDDFRFVVRIANIEPLMVLTDIWRHVDLVMMAAHRVPKLAPDAAVYWWAGADPTPFRPLVEALVSIRGCAQYRGNEAQVTGARVQL